jgi:hypothetical protein
MVKAGPYTSNITAFPQHTYYVRAYATNSLGTAYDEEQRTFTTMQSNNPLCYNR